ncbi:MAG: hypothetical protein IT238_02975 [Bacteroidia bacterium]|nr:hypothetical protein [Bacteroidia bacterium]
MRNELVGDSCELAAAYALLNRSKKRFLESAQAWDFPYFFRDMPDIACNEEVVRKFLGTQPCHEFLRTALEMCVHPIMLKVFEAWLEGKPSEKEVKWLKEYCKDFLAAYPEAAEKVNSLPQ